jgi:hypothetical protein
MNKKTLGGFLGAMISAALFTACGAVTSPPIVAPPTAATIAIWTATCEALFREELGREIDPPGVEWCLAGIRGGTDLVGMRAAIRATPEYVAYQERLKQPPAPAIRPALAVRIDGRFWVTDTGTFRPLFQSGLALLARGPPERAAFLDETRALGFNGIRVFAGDLGWAGQTPESARAALPALLDEAAARGLYVYVCALTGGGYDIEAHLRAIVDIVRGRPNVLLESFNEIGHPTQSDIGQDPARALQLAKRVIPAGITWTLGAPIGTDEPTPEGTYPTSGGLFNDAHLDRARDLYNQVRRLREIYAISEVTRTPAMSGEPIGIAEVPMPGKQRLWDDQAMRFAFAYGVLCRGFELGCVFHSEQGLQGQPLGPNTTAAARVFLAGWHAIPTDDRLTFVNAGWAGSPVAGADFDNGLVRAYSFVSGARGFTVLVGLKGDPRVVWGGGWRSVSTIADQPGIRVIEITK